MIYLDNAATTLHKPQCVIDAVTEALHSLGNSSRGTHEQALTAARSIFHAREAAGRLFHYPADHVCFTLNSTMALNTAICGLLGPGDHIISTDCEHNSVLRPLYRLEAEGAELSFVPADRRGCVDPEDFIRLIRPNTKAIVCTHASNLTGNVIDIREVGRIAKEHGLLFIVDASQTAGVFPIDGEDMQIDALCFTGHKSLLGPQGTGGLCVREGVRIRSLVVGGSGISSYSMTQPEAYPTALEAGTLNGHGLAGLGAALDFLEEYGTDRMRKEEQDLAWSFYEGVAEIPGVKVYGDFRSRERAPIVALNIGDRDSAEVSDELAEEWDIATRPGAHCAPRMHQALGTVEQGIVRFSFSYTNTPAEVETAVEAVRSLAEE